jgi:hypothetical protein
MSIDLYVKQLAEDLRLATANSSRKQNELPLSSEDSLAKHFEEVENYLTGDQVPLSEILGISTAQLPPPDKLNEQQQILLYNEMENLMNANNFYPDFPENIPTSIKYTVMRDHWDNEHVDMPSGSSHIEFCNYEPAECPFPEKYCTCKNLYMPPTL